MPRRVGEDGDGGLDDLIWTLLGRVDRGKGNVGATEGEKRTILLNWAISGMVGEVESRRGEDRCIGWSRVNCMAEMRPDRI